MTQWCNPHVSVSVKAYTQIESMCAPVGVRILILLCCILLRAARLEAGCRLWPSRQLTSNATAINQRNSSRLSSTPTQHIPYLLINLRSQSFLAGQCKSIFHPNKGSASSICSDFWHPINQRLNNIIQYFTTHYFHPWFQSVNEKMYLLLMRQQKWQMDDIYSAPPDAINKTVWTMPVAGSFVFAAKKTFLPPRRQLYAFLFMHATRPLCPIRVGFVSPSDTNSGFLQTRNKCAWPGREKKKETCQEMTPLAGQRESRDVVCFSLIIKTNPNRGVQALPPLCPSLSRPASSFPSGSVTFHSVTRVVGKARARLPEPKDAHFITNSLYHLQIYCCCFFLLLLPQKQRTEKG